MGRLRPRRPLPRSVSIEVMHSNLARHRREAERARIVLLVFNIAALAGSVGIVIWMVFR